MPFLDDIWITLGPKEVAGFMKEGQTGPGEQEIAAALEVFHQSREARADYDLVPPDKSPLPQDKAPSGTIAVAATLGEKVEQHAGMPGMDLCLRAALSQLQNYVNYRIMKRLGPQKLHLGWPVVPGGAGAAQLTNDQVLELLDRPQAGVRAEDDGLYPAWSLVWLYPVSPKPDTTSSCSSCQKDCALRK